MANKKLFLGILATVLVFGMAVIGCGGDDDKDISFFDAFDFSTSDPDGDLLAEFDLDITKFNSIKDAGSGGFKGWTLDEDDDLIMTWTGRSVSHFNAVADVLDNLFDEKERENEGGVYDAWGEGYSVTFLSVRTSEDGFYAPAGTLIAFFSKE